MAFSLQHPNFPWDFSSTVSTTGFKLSLFYDFVFYCNVVCTSIFSNILFLLLFYSLPSPLCKWTVVSVSSFETGLKQVLFDRFSQVGKLQVCYFCGASWSNGYGIGLRHRRSWVQTPPFPKHFWFNGTFWRNGLMGETISRSVDLLSTVLWV